jgi:hypothetical protein
MAVIAFKNGGVWAVARWAFRRFLFDVVRHFPERSEMNERIRIAYEHDGLHLDHLVDPLATDLRRAMHFVVQETLAGKTTGYDPQHVELDAEGRKMYEEAMDQLRKLIEDDLIGPGPDN